MHDDVDRSLLDRLQALRGASATPEKKPPASPRVSIDVIERTKTPTREEALAARLRSLREQTRSPPSPSPSPSVAAARPSSSTPSRAHGTAGGWGQTAGHEADVDDDAEAALQTDDATLEELLGGVDPLTAPPSEPREEDVRALLEELSRAVPRDGGGAGEAGDARVQPEGDDERADDSDDSDDSEGGSMGREADQVIAQFRDELDLEASRRVSHGDDACGTEQAETPPPTIAHDDASDGGGGLVLPSVPCSLPDDAPASAPKPSTLDDLTTRMAALGTPSSSRADLPLPSVPTSKPGAGGPRRRLETTTRYTDDDVDSWCTACLEDATLRCLGCDDDAYCARCWHDMHVGPAACFDERSHRAVHFSRRQKREGRRVALGAA